MTNILSLPLLSVTFETADNEDWRDSVAFAAAGSVTGYATTGNTGNGGLFNLSIAQGAYIGDYVLTTTGPGTYRVSDPDGYTIGAGVMGVPFSASGLSFTLAAGSTAFDTDDTFTLTVLPAPLDITGIRFVLQMRRAAGVPTVVLSGDTTTNTLVNGGASGVLGLAFPLTLLSQIPANAVGQPYAVDIVAIADGVQRRCVTGTNNLVKGITFPAA